MAVTGRRAARQEGAMDRIGTLAAATARFNALPADDAERELRACCAAPEWATAVAGGRPYPDGDALLAAGARAFAELGWDQVRSALDAHPRIGEQAAGSGRDAMWSGREQSGVGGATAPTRAALAAGNAAYERRFGHVYLVRAAGRSADELLALLPERLGNDPAVEREVIRRELGEITMLRLDALLSALAAG